MKELVRSMFKIDLFSSLIYLILGLLLFLVPADILKTVSIVIGIFILIAGIIPIINYFKNRNTSFQTANLISGILLIVCGLILTLHATLLETVIAIMIGVIMIVNSVSKIEYTLELRDNKVEGWVVSMIFSLLTLLIGLFFIFNSFMAIKIITKTLGFIIIVYTIIDIIEIIFLRIRLKKVLKESETVKVIDAD